MIVSFVFLRAQHINTASPHTNAISLPAQTKKRALTGSSQLTVSPVCQVSSSTLKSPPWKSYIKKEDNLSLTSLPRKPQPTSHLYSEMLTVYLLGCVRSLEECWPSRHYWILFFSAHIKWSRKAPMRWLKKIRWPRKDLVCCKGQAHLEVLSKCHNGWNHCSFSGVVFFVTGFFVCFVKWHLFVSCTRAAINFNIHSWTEGYIIGAALTTLLLPWWLISVDVIGYSPVPWARSHDERRRSKPRADNSCLYPEHVSVVWEYDHMAFPGKVPRCLCSWSSWCTAARTTVWFEIL